MEEKTLNVAIGLATGRKQFKSVLSTYIYHLNETKFLQENNVKLHLIVAYDTNDNLAVLGNELQRCHITLIVRIVHRILQRKGPSV